MITAGIPWMALAIASVSREKVSRGRSSVSWEKQREESSFAVRIVDNAGAVPASTRKARMSLVGKDDVSVSKGINQFLLKRKFLKSVV